MSTAFATPGNNVSTTVGATTTGTGLPGTPYNIALATGGGAKFPALPSPNTYNWYYRVTVCQVAFAYSPTATTANYTIYKADSISGDNLHVVSVLEGTTDRVYNIGDIVEVRLTAGTLNDVQNAINTLEAGGGGGVTIGNAVSGGTNNSMLYVNGSGNLGDTGPTWNGTTFGAKQIVGTGTTAGTPSTAPITATSATTTTGSAVAILMNGVDASSSHNTSTSGCALVLSRNIDGSPPNRQLVLQSSDQNNNTTFGFRYIVGFPVPVLDGVSTDGTVAGSIGVGQAGAPVGFGWTSSWTQSTLNANAHIHVVTSAATKIPVMIQAAASQSADLQQWQNSSASVLSAVGPAGHIRTVLSAGAPTGTPPTGSMAYDTTNNKFYVYNGAWKSVTLA
jgi:hypothetical protein